MGEPTEDQRELSRKQAFIARWKRPQGLVSRARILALLQTRKDRYLELKSAAEQVFLSSDPSESGWIDLRGIDLSRSDLHGCFVRADLSYATLDGADLTEADLLYCGLSRASLKGVHAKAAVMSGIMATGASFDDANLPGVIFTSAILKGASFQRANLERAMLDLTEVDGADFRGALLTDARFEHTQVKLAIFDSPMPEGVKL
jgi:uncharacterized protein YjbI with pentapeptide repeats